MNSQSHLPLRKKKILVLVSQGGGGHKTAAESFQQILGNQYDIEINFVMETVLRSFDMLNLLTGRRYTGEDLYNTLLKIHWNKLLRWLVGTGHKIWRPNKIAKIFSRYLKNQSSLPDLIVSFTPYINLGIAKAAKERNIPFLIIPTDLDGSEFLFGFPEQPLDQHFKVGLCYDDPEVKRATFQKSAFKESQLSLLGFPVRPACLKKYSREELKAIRQKFNLLESHKTASLIMGAVGGNLIFEHVKILCRLDPRQHQLRLQINVCTGKNLKIATKIRNLLMDQGAQFLGGHSFLLPTGLVLHICGYTPDLIELMAASDLIITKTGSCTVNEAIYLGKKLLLDNTSRSSARYLSWEKFNISFVQKHGLGHAFSESSQLLMLIPSQLKYPDKPQTSLNLPNFEENIAKIVPQMIR